MRNFINIVSEQSQQLTEVTLAKYTAGKKFLISDSATGQKTKQQLAAGGFDTTSYIELIDPRLVDLKKIDVKTYHGTGDGFFAFKNEPGQIWLAQGSTNQIQSSLVHYKGAGEDAKLTNRGETAEGILGAAMFAKFTKRESKEEIGTVTVGDIINVLDRLKNVGDDLYQLIVKDADNQHADTVTFLLKLKTGPYRDLMDPTKRTLLAPDFSSAVGYVNSPMADRYSKYFYLNGRTDELAVIADGAASETERKTDVWVAVKDKEGKLRQLKLNASLKVGGVGQFGQVGGSDMESMTKLWDYFGINIDPWAVKFEELAKKDQLNALEYIYQRIAQRLAGELAGDNDDEEAKFVDNLAHAVTFFATLGDPNVELVDFDKGGFKILRFKNLKEKLRNINLTATYASSKARPEIVIHDASDPKKKLLNIRVKVENRPGGIYVRNIIEKGSFLEEITQVQSKLEKDIEAEVVQAVPSVITGKRVEIQPPGKQTTEPTRVKRDSQSPEIRKKR